MFDLPHPRESKRLHGHKAALAEFRASKASGKLHHAWILGGDEGIGKATFAYQLIYELLSGQTEKWDDRVFHKLKAQSHPNLLVLERPVETTATGLNKNIAVDTVRKIHAFFGNTSGEPGMRICLADSLDDLNNNGLNALLKMVEEPPENALFIMISHRPDRIMPTIKSRSRLLKMSPLSEKEVASVFHDLEIDVVPERGSVRRTILRNEASSKDLLGLIKSYFLKADPAVLTNIADKIGGKEPFLLDLMVEEIENHLNSKMKQGNIAPLYDVWTAINTDLGRTKALNLDRKTFTYALFNRLAEAHALS